MAAVVSTRIARLQAISPRTAAVDLQSGINVPAAATVGGAAAGTLAANVWNTDITFSSASATQVNWSSGTIRDAAGTSRSISAGNTGAMAALTYIYLDTAVSVTVLQTTTTYSTAVGSGKTLVAVAQNGTGGASVVPMAGANPVINGGTQIAARSILAGNIAAGTITANELTVSTLSAITANLGTVTSGNINSSGYIAATGTSGITLNGSTYYASLIGAPATTSYHGVAGKTSTGAGGWFEATDKAGSGAVINNLGTTGSGRQLAIYNQTGDNYFGGHCMFAVDMYPYSDEARLSGTSSYAWLSVYTYGLIIRPGEYYTDTTTQSLITHHATHNLAAAKYYGGAVPTNGTGPFIYFGTGGKVIGFVDAVGAYYNSTNW